MDVARGEFFRMADYLPQPTPYCEETDFGAAEHKTDGQLEFGFASDDRLTPPKAEVPNQSRRELRARTAGRDLRVAPVQRPLEELQLEHAVSSYLPPGKLLNLRLTDNCYTIISVRRGGDGYQVRAHRMFAGLEPRLVRALARYVVHNDQRASKLIGEFIERNESRIVTGPRRERPPVLRTRGKHHDLSAIYDRLNRAYFQGAHDARISWGSARRPANRRSIKVGSFSVEDRLIRVHPLLDQEGVPGYFLDWIVFHEMLHGKHAIRKVDGRRCFHPPEFAEEERQFPDYGRARLWEKTHLDMLLGA
jgi:hypothetical protein